MNETTGVVIALSVLLAVAIAVIIFLLKEEANDSRKRLISVGAYLQEYETLLERVAASKYTIPRDIDREALAEYCPCSVCMKCEFAWKQVGCLKHDWDFFEDITLAKRIDFIRIAYWRSQGAGSR